MIYNCAIGLFVGETGFVFLVIVPFQQRLPVIGDYLSGIHKYIGISLSRILRKDLDFKNVDYKNVFMHYCVRNWIFLNKLVEEI